MGKRLVIFCPYPIGTAPSQRFRFEQVLEDFTAKGYEIQFNSFYDQKNYHKLYEEGNTVVKVKMLILGFLKRWIQVFSLKRNDKIFVHREMAPIGPPVFEFILRFLFGFRFNYDFDDAIWRSNVSEVNRRYSWLKCYWKVSYICRWAYSVTAGNQHLQEYALDFNERSEFLPTTVDMIRRHNKIKYHSQQKELCTIGWTGSHTTMQYLPSLVPVLNDLSSKYAIEFQVISNQDPELELDDVRFIKWSSHKEIEQLLEFDIGVMPIEDSEWEKGKCAFKAIQYMALGIPVVLSPVGANLDVVTEGKSGLFATSEQEWFKKLELLISDVQERRRIGSNGKQVIEQKYSTASQLFLYHKIVEAL